MSGTSSSLSVPGVRKAPILSRAVPGARATPGFGAARSATGYPLQVTKVVLGIPLVWLALASIVGFVGTLLLVPIVVVRMPSDYFLEQDPPTESFRGRFPGLSLAVQIAKNAVGVALVLVGLALLVLPGQGILTILLGLTLVDFPGKRALELVLIRRDHVHRSLDWVRRRFGHEPLQIPER